MAPEKSDTWRMASEDPEIATSDKLGFLRIAQSQLIVTPQTTAKDHRSGAVHTET